MAKQKSCKKCKTIYEGKGNCPKCDSKDFVEGFKGRIVLINPEKSEVAKKLNREDKGEFAIRN